jgi:DNA-binding response OmpR family regulator
MTKKVLIADDEPNIVLSLEFLMRKAGYDLRVARDGAEALREIREWSPDLVLLDVMLPEKDGFEVLQSTRALDDGDRIKIVMLTARGREVDMAKGMGLGADAYVTKPFSTQELVQKVNELLGRDDAPAA